MSKIIGHLKRRLSFSDAQADRALLIEAMQDILGEIRRINLRLDDPAGDGSGRVSRPPDADSFNELSSSIQCTAISVLDTIGVARA